MSFAHGWFRMILGCYCYVLFWDFENFWRKSQKGGKLENLGKNRLLRHNVGNPRRGVDLRQGVGYPCRDEAEVQNGTPQVRRGVVKLHRREGLRIRVAVLHHDVATIHKGQLLCCGVATIH